MGCCQSRAGEFVLESKSLLITQIQLILNKTSRLDLLFQRHYPEER